MRSGLTVMTWSFTCDERARVGAHQQGLELFLQALLLLGRGLAPGRADGGGRHALEVHVRHDLAVDQRMILSMSPALMDLSALMAPRVVGQALDQRVGRLVGSVGRADEGDGGAEQQGRPEPAAHIASLKICCSSESPSEF
jgi:hypothetical protein